MKPETSSLKTQTKLINVYPESSRKKREGPNKQNRKWEKIVII